MAVHAVYARREHLDPKIRLFIDFLKESFGPEPYWAQRLAPWLEADCPVWRNNRFHIETLTFA